MLMAMFNIQTNTVPAPLFNPQRQPDQQESIQTNQPNQQQPAAINPITSQITRNEILSNLSTLLLDHNLVTEEQSFINFTSMTTNNGIVPVVAITPGYLNDLASNAVAANVRVNQLEEQNRRLVAANTRVTDLEEQNRRLNNFIPNALFVGFTGGIVTGAVIGTAIAALARHTGTR